MPGTEDSTPQGGGGAFEATPWSLVLRAGDRQTDRSGAALAALCEAYWRPLFGYVRHRIRDYHRAQDLTQAFFARLLEKDYLRQVDPARGRFRTFLLTACQNFLANENRHEQTQAAGGAVQIVPLDWDVPDGDPDNPALTPEEVFDRQWSLTLLARVLKHLEAECQTEEQRSRFTLLKPCLSVPTRDLDYTSLASQLGIDPPAVRMAVSRFRRRYRELLREEIAKTVPSSADVEQELADLFQALSR